MSGFLHALVIAAVVALVAARQFSARPVTDEKRWWALPVILLFVSIRKADAPDPRHEVLSVVLLGSGLVVGAVTGAGWGWTARLWREGDGSVWSRGTRATVSVCVGGMTLRASLAGVAVLLGVHHGVAAVMMTLALTLFARSGVLARRARTVRQAYATAAAGGVPSRPAWEPA